MPLSACTIQTVQPYHNPNEGRDIINTNFQCLSGAVSTLEYSVLTGSSMTNTATTVFTSGSSGSYSIKALNDSAIDATGNYSYAEGANTTAIGDASHTEGTFTTAIGAYSHSEGFYTTASGSSSHAEGRNSYASGIYSHAEGYQTTAIGQYSHAEGVLSIASSNGAHAEGGAIQYGNGYSGGTASGDGSHAEGISSTASSLADHSEGHFTKAIGGYGSHAEGTQTLASGQASHAEGGSSTAIGNQSHAEGNNTTASGSGSHSEGGYNTSIGAWSHSEGQGNTSIGDYSHVEGMFTITTGMASHAEGLRTTAGGIASHSEGWYTYANGDASHVGGYGYYSGGEVRVVSLGSASFAHFKLSSGGVDLGAKADYSAILGGQNHNIASGANSSGIFAGTNHRVNSSVLRSVIIGGNSITATTNDTVYIPNLNIATTPSSGSYSDSILVRSNDGSIKSISQPQYLEYRANLTQASTNAPSATTLGNITLTGGSWSYSSVGSYFFTKTGAFSATSNVEVEIQNAQVLAYTMSNAGFNLISASVYDNDTIEVRTSYWGAYPNAASGGTGQAVVTPGANGSSASDAMSDDILSNTRFCVRVWL